MISSGIPEIFNFDQGSQFTILVFIKQLKQKNIRISMDGQERAMDNIFTEGLWRSVKYEEVYIKDYQSVHGAKQGISNCTGFYNYEGPHHSLNYKTPAEVCFDNVDQKKKT